MTSDANSAPSAGTILLGPGAAIPVPYFDSGPQDGAAASDLVPSILHALRRRWFSISVIGAIVGAAAGIGAWYGIETEYTASARLLVPSREMSALLDNSPRGGDYELRKRTHLQLITSPSLLNTVLQRDDKIKHLRIVQQQQLDEAVMWLSACVTASFPSDAEVMEVRVRCPDRHASETLAGLIREVYIDEATRNIDQDRAALNSDLTKSLADFETRFETEQQRLAGLMTMAGSANATEQLAPEEVVAQREYDRKLQRIGAIQESIWQVNFRLRAIESTAKDKEEPGEGEGSSLVSDQELQDYLQLDDEYRGAIERIAALEAQIAKAPEDYNGEGLRIAIDVYEGKLAQAREAVAHRTEQIRKGLDLKRRETVAKPLDPALLQAELAALENEKAVLEQELKDTQPPQKATRAALPPGTDLIMAQLRVENLKSVIERIQQRIDENNVTYSQGPGRAGVSGIRALGEVFVLDRADHQRKLIQSSAVGGAAFMAIVALVVLFDLRRGRLNHTDDVSERLRINVLGTIPLLRGKGSKRFESSQRLAESVDGVAAALLCRTTGDAHRVVMISSAMPGEGKTTLAANLATSLAAAGRRTLLVDFDLRRPMLHKVYQCPIGPGVGELLSEANFSEVAEYVQETGAENLWMIPAGARRQGALVELAGDRVGELFEELKEHFEYIVVDGPPVLLVVDTRLVARHADGVVISMLRDVSELAKVKSACQLLQTYRVAILGGVVIGASGDVYYGYPPGKVSTSA